MDAWGSCGGSANEVGVGVVVRTKALRDERGTRMASDPKGRGTGVALNIGN